MRLINTKTGNFVWVEDPRQEHYAVLSHVWAKESDPGYVPEQTYQDLLQLQAAATRAHTSPISKFSDKLRRFCETALQDGFELGWADTCCIDKTSSSELSEAINSMYSWYAYSGACYAFLRDVNPPTSDPKWRATFKRSKWFKRGWTLQELIASRIVIFLSKGWEVLGSKHSLAADISSETGIDIEVLTFQKSVEEIPIARRMAWAHSRETSRLEDEAYCLMGIFGASIQTNYGEGRYAFIRLQEKILSQSTDQTIFAWGGFYDEPSSSLLPSNASSIPASGTPSNLSLDSVAPLWFLKQYLLAPSPKDFEPSRCLNMVSLPRDVFQRRLGLSFQEDLYQLFDITPYGLRTQFPLLNLSSDHHLTSATHCAILACEDPDKGFLALLLRPRGQVDGNEFFAGAKVVKHDEKNFNSDEPFGRDRTWDNYCRLMYITPEQLSLLGKVLSGPSSDPHHEPTAVRVLSSVYIPHFASRSAIELDRDSSLHAVLREMSGRFEVEFCPWSKTVLERDGYRVSWGSSGSQDSVLHKPFASSNSVLNRNPSLENSVTISDESGVYLVIQVGICSCDFARRTGSIIGVLVSSYDTDSLDRKFPSRDHIVEHCIHVGSWSFGHGFASREIEFDSPKELAPRLDSQKEQPPPPRLSLRLTFTSIAPLQRPTSTVRRYRLGAELRERNSSELQSPRQPLPLNPTSLRLGSNPSVSQPPESSVASSTEWRTQEPRDSTRPADVGTHDVNKGYGYTAGLVALGGFLAVALLSLNRYVVR